MASDDEHRNEEEETRFENKDGESEHYGERGKHSKLLFFLFNSIKLRELYLWLQ